MQWVSSIQLFCKKWDFYKISLKVLFVWFSLFYLPFYLLNHIYFAVTFNADFCSKCTCSSYIWFKSLLVQFHLLIFFFFCNFIFESLVVFFCLYKIQRCPWRTSFMISFSVSLAVYSGAIPFIWILPMSQFSIHPLPHLKVLYWFHCDHYFKWSYLLNSHVGSNQLPFGVKVTRTLNKCVISFALGTIYLSLLSLLFNAQEVYWGSH